MNVQPRQTQRSSDGSSGMALPYEKASEEKRPCDGSAETRRLAVVSFTPGGRAQAERIGALLQQPLGAVGWKMMHSQKPERLKEWCGHQFTEADAILFIGAMGIAVRTIAPFLQHKSKDPAVLVMDERAKHVISVLSGHLGGGNELTCQLAERLSAEAVITTASDVNHKLAIDVFAKKNGLYLTDFERAKQVAAAIVAGRPVSFCSSETICGMLPPELSAPPEAAEFEVVVTAKMDAEQKGSWSADGAAGAQTARPQSASLQETEHLTASEGARRLQRLVLVPPVFVLGIGCKKGTSAADIERAVEEELLARRIYRQSIGAAATITLKREETGLLEFCRAWKLPLTFYSAAALREAPGMYESSSFVQEITGVDNVCERAAVLKAQEGNPCVKTESCLVMPKTKKGGITLALARREWSVEFE